MTAEELSSLRDAVEASEPLGLRGRVVRCSALTIEAVMPQVAVGSACDVRTADGRLLSAEVVGFTGPRALLMPVGGMDGICEGCEVVPRPDGALLPVGDALLGRIVDAQMRPVDGGPAPLLNGRMPIDRAPPPAMARRRISAPLPLGIRVIDSCLTMGEGQRVGIFAGAGVGKSVLLGMVARHCRAEVIVVGLVGERGREVREFVERDLGPEGLARSTVVVATGDEPPLVRIRAAMAATALAEHHRRRGKKVMLLMDSLTRVAMAQREVGLAAGEPPTSKGYPPSVFALLPRLVERAGNDEGQGSITALYTVLVEGDDLSDPIADTCRAALDGHLVLSRKLASAGHFPAVDVLASVSRVMTDVVPPDQVATATTARELLAAYREAQDLIDVGAYERGSNPRVDRALACKGALEAFLRQKPTEAAQYVDTLAQLGRALTPPPEVRRG